MKHNVVGWFEVYVEDMDRAREFYRSVFQYGEYTDLSTPGMQMFAFPWVEQGEYASGALVRAEGMKPGGGGTLVYFQSEDCAIEESRVGDAGGKVIRPKFGIGEYGFCVLAEDSEGNLIGIHSKQ